MTILQAIILGITQGLTEFLPISSSAHLVLVPYLLGWDIPDEPAFVFNVLVQMGTIVAVVAYFWRDLIEIAVSFFQGLFTRRPFEATKSRLGWYIILASIPAGISGVLIKDTVEAAFASPPMTAFFLLCTAAMMVTAERLGKRTRPLEKMTWLDALIVGVFQLAALFPGVSRSGSTISGGMLRHLDRPAAARFSFLISTPIMLAAGIWTGKDLADIPNLEAFIPVMVVGMITAAGVGYVAIRWLLGYLARHSLYLFAAYCTVVGLLILAIETAKL